MPGTDWLGWHHHYDDPTSRFSRRLAAVQARLREALDQAPPGRITTLSVCAGQGRDLFGALADHPRRHDVVATLVELDPENAAIARETAERLGLDATVVEADAGLSSSYVGAVPASLVVLVGFFAYLEEADGDRLLASLPQLCGPGATVVWARGRQHHWSTSTRLRAGFEAAGFREQPTDPAQHDDEFRVGVERFTGVPRPLEPGRRIFRFRDPWIPRRIRAKRWLLRLPGRLRRRVRRACRGLRGAT